MMHRSLRFATLSVVCVIGSFAVPRTAQAQGPPYPEVTIEEPEHEADFPDRTKITPNGTSTIDEGEYVTVIITNVYLDEMGMPEINTAQKNCRVDEDGIWKFPEEFTLFGGSVGGSWEVKAWITAFPPITTIHSGTVDAE